MYIQKRIRVLVVDDSIVFRKVLSKGISSDPNIEIVATANDPFDARDKIIQFEPDVMTCDVEMPKMNGIEFVRRLLPQYPLPVVVVSSVSEAVFNALNAGAVDFVVKPDVRSAKSVEEFIDELIIKIKIASMANLSIRKRQNTLHKDIGPKAADHAIARSAAGDGTAAGGADAAYTDRIIAIGASTGGTEAISSLLGSLPPDMPGMVIVQHIPPVFSRMFADRLNRSTQLKVKEARDGDYLGRGQVLIAPGDAHMGVRKAGSGYRAEVFHGDKVNGHCPSVDILFESVARECGDKAIGIILTGMGYDGAKGLLSMRKKGARTIGQDEKSCVVYGMPKAAYNIGAVERQTALENMPQTIYSMLRK